MSVFPDDEKESVQSDNESPPHVCKLCGKSFPADASLQEHVRTHQSAAKEKDYQCETCGKTFCQASSLKAHQLVHSGLKPHSCSICQASFRKTHHLRRHMLIHTGERPYQCDFCDRTFTSSGNLNKHRAIHLGEKNFECEHCSKKFTQSSNLTKHRAIHLRQQKQAQLTAGEDGHGSTDPNPPLVVKKGRGRKKINNNATTLVLDRTVPEETFEIPLTEMTEDEIRQQQEAEGHAAVLHIVGTSDDHQMIDDQETEVSYQIIADGDVIIEI